MFAAEPPPTRFDLRFVLGDIPIRIHPLFWLMAVIFGSSTGSLILIGIWVVLVFVSILIHEFGHALAMRFYSMDSHIVLYSFGGLAIPDTPSYGARPLGPGQKNLISVSGALAGFLFAAVVLFLVVLVGGSVGVEWFLGVIPLPWAILPGISNIYLNFLISNLLWINVFWGLVNLMPVLPLDGGNIARNLMLSADPLNGTTKALWISTITGGVIAAIGLVFLNSIFIGLFFGFLAVGSYQQLRPGFGRPW